MKTNENQQKQKNKTKTKPKPIFIFQLLSYWLLFKPLLGLPWQPRMSFGMLIQVNLDVIFVVASYLNTVIHKMILWQLDSLLSSAKEQMNSNYLH